MNRAEITMVIMLTLCLNVTIGYGQSKTSKITLSGQMKWKNDVIRRRPGPAEVWRAKSNTIDTVFIAKCTGDVGSALLAHDIATGMSAVLDTTVEERHSYIRDYFENDYWILSIKKRQ